VVGELADLATSFTQGGKKPITIDIVFEVVLSLGHPPLHTNAAINKYFALSFAAEDNIGVVRVVPNVVIR
jgi:hypothetical protein